MKTSTIYFAKMVLVSLIVSLPWSLCAQLEEINSGQRSASVQHERNYRYTSSAQPDTITIKVISPYGQMQALPVNASEVKAMEQIDFQLDTKHWTPGTYQIIAEGKYGRHFKRLKVLAREPKEIRPGKK